MSVLGIDLAAGASKTHACLLDPRDGALRARLVAGCDDERLLELARGRDKVAIDAPFGWPNDFVDALNAHRAAEAWPAPDDADPAVFRASLSFRATDRVVMHTRRPLSVSTDKLGVTAMRCAFLLHRWSLEEPIDRTGRGRFVEVYPASALIRWGLAGSGYKRNQAALAVALDALMKQIPALELTPDDREACASNDDAFDALVAALVGRAAFLGLTDPPAAEQREQATQEGWIHMPVRGSLPFLGRDRRALRSNPTKALADALSETGVALTPDGYASSLDDVVLPTFSSATKDAIRADLAGKGGSELLPKGDAPPRFYAAHSSAALAANVFGPFLKERAEVPIGDETFTGSTHLEVECRSGLRGTPPTLDCLVDGERILAVESKLTETFTRHEAHFEDAYADAMESTHPTWRAEFSRLIEDPHRYRYLDAAQLVKHYLGLRRAYPNRDITLVYLNWTPVNSEDIAECSIHAAELAEFRRQVRDPAVRFVGMSYQEVWVDWESSSRPAWMRAHVAELRRRYDVPV